MESDCIFCKIIQGKIPSFKVYEDDKTLAFLDIGPVNKGHALVIPKEHYELYMDVPENLLLVWMASVRKVAKAVMKATNSDGLNISLSMGKAAGQTVNHAHFHVIPRFEGDGFRHWPQGKYGEGEALRYVDKIKADLE